MLSLSPAERRDLRAKAHRLRPVVSVGQHGLTAGVLHEIDVNLLAHELIKVRVFIDARGAREAVLSRICAELEAAPVQHIGKLLVVWRPASPAAGDERAAPRPKTKGESAKRKRAEPRSQERQRRRRAPPRGASVVPLAAAKSTPQARRPRDPRARTPARPPSGHTGRTRSQVRAPEGRRRRRTP
jgi:RNA-binding protein